MVQTQYSLHLQLYDEDEDEVTEQLEILTQIVQVVTDEADEEMQELDKHLFSQLVLEPLYKGLLDEYIQLHHLLMVLDEDEEIHQLGLDELQVIEEIDELDLILQSLEALYDMLDEDDEAHMDEQEQQELLLIDEGMLDYDPMYEVMQQLTLDDEDDEDEIMQQIDLIEVTDEAELLSLPIQLAL